jgi:hypothetical protein
MFGAGFARDFWRTGWPLGAALVLVLLGINGYYCSNRRLFFLSEREDWPALVQYLEGRVLQEGRYSPYLVRLLANTYLILADSASVTALERKTALAKPRLVDANALIFGAARLLGRDVPGAVSFFARRLDSGKTESPQWIRWYYGFSLLLDRQFAAAGEQFMLLARESRDAVIAGMAAFFLAGSLARLLPEQGVPFTAAAEEGRLRIKKALPSLESWRKETGKLRTEVYAVILVKYIDEAGAWLYGQTPIGKAI